jgi:hypothetical protein
VQLALAWLVVLGFAAGFGILLCLESCRWRREGCAVGIGVAGGGVSDWLLASM